MTRKILLGIAAFSMFAAGCSGSRLRVGATKDGEVIEAEGWAPVNKDDILGTKRSSLADAQKKAVERVVGVFISAKTRVAKAITVDQNILADVGGYVKKYDVLSEREEDGFYKTRIRALVLYKKIGEDLKNLGLIRPPPPPGNPKVLVAITSEGKWSEEREGRASGAVRRAFLERGYRVVDINDSRNIGVKPVSDTEAALKAGRDRSADLVVKGEAGAYPLEDARLGGFKSFRARVAIEVYNPGTGEVVARKTSEASGLDPTEKIAEAKALENAGQLAGEELAEELSGLLTKRVKVALRVLGVKSLKEVQQLAEDLRLQPEVASAALSEFRKAGAELAVTTEGMAGDELVALIMRMKRYAFQIRAVTPYVVEVSVGDR